MWLVPALPCRADYADASRPDAAYAHAIRSINPHVALGQSRLYARTLLSDAHRMHVDPRLVMAVVTVESHWDTRALSVHGAEGLGQLKPGTARDLGVNPWSSRGNLEGITRYLHQLLVMFRASRQSMREAIAGYNAGPYAVRSVGGIPQRYETKRYVAKVIAALHAFKARLSAQPSADEIAAALGAPAVLEREQAAYWGAQ